MSSRRWRGSIKEKAYRSQRSREMREIIREAAEGMACVGMDKVITIPLAHIRARRIWDVYGDRRSITGRILGDPIPERSAWWPRRHMEAAE